MSITKIVETLDELNKLKTGITYTNNDGYINIYHNGEWICGVNERDNIANISYVEFSMNCMLLGYLKAKKQYTPIIPSVVTFDNIQNIDIQNLTSNQIQELALKISFNDESERVRIVQLYIDKYDFFTASENFSNLLNSSFLKETTMLVLQKCAN